MKVIFPLDVITITGFGAFLVIPSLVSPTQDQQISILTFLAGILIALSAFTMSAQSMLPQLEYTTVFDVHSNFCFVAIAILTITVAGIPSDNLSIFKNFETIGGIQRRGVLFIMLFIFLMLEHVLLYCLVRWVWALPQAPNYQGVMQKQRYTQEDISNSRIRRTVPPSVPHLPPNMSGIMPS